MKRVWYLVKYRSRPVWGGIHRTKKAAIADAKDCSDKHTKVVRIEVARESVVWESGGAS